MDLSELRKKIDDIDKKIAQMLEKRFDIVSVIACEKKKNNLKILDGQREKDVIENALANTGKDEYKKNISRIFEAVMSESRKMQEGLLQKKPQHQISIAGGKAVYCGTEGSFAEEALLAFFGNDIKKIPAGSFEEAAAMVEEGGAGYGLLPIENSITGAVTTIEDMLLSRDVYITGETILPVRHHLLGLKDAELEGIKTVCSHPQAIEQCSRFLSDKDYTVVLSNNTAFSARDIAQSGDKTAAAIASKRAADLYGLKVLKSDIQNARDNYTRFVIIENKLKQEGDKISVICVIPHKAGSLYALLGIFARRGLNLLKLLARPISESAWHYRFHIDLSGSLKDKNVADALKEAEAHCDTLKITGCFRAVPAP